MIPTALPAEIPTVLAQYFARPELANLRVTSGPQGFSGANVWKVKSSSAEFALRRWPQPGLPVDRLRGLHRLLQHLSDHGLTFVAAPIRSLSGETLLTWQDRCWQLEPWLTGQADFQTCPSEERLSSAMRALARWHHVAASFQPDFNSHQWFRGMGSACSPAVQERWARLRLFSQHDDHALRAEIRAELDADRRQLCNELLDFIQLSRDAVISQLASLSYQKFALQPCLRDIWRDHVLFTGAEVTGLIDPSACRVENVATDLARLLGSLVEDDAARWQLALAMYRTHHPLTLTEEALVIALDQSGMLLSAVTWLDWLFVARRNFPDAAKVDERLLWLHRRMQKLIMSS